MSRTRLLIAMTLLLPAAAAAQSLRGSPESVDRMYYRASANGLKFFATADEVKAAASRGQVVMLTGNMDYALVGTQLPYVRPATLRFIEALGAAHRQACGEPIVVTSGVRPTSRKLRNGHVKSVHPTGMAVDIRKSPGRCRDWLRRALLGLEREGVIEATEENRPPHFHIAVFSPAEPARIMLAANRTADPRTVAAKARRSGRSTRARTTTAAPKRATATARRATAATAATKPASAKATSAKRPGGE